MRCEECGMKECCGAELGPEIERLRKELNDLKEQMSPRDARVEVPKDVLIEQEYNAVNKSHYRVILEYDDRDDAYECWHWLREWRYAMQGDIDKGRGPF